ncbi:MAG: ABC transporter ATP-binding protein [Myxococcota bacterium]
MSGVKVEIAGLTREYKRGERTIEVLRDVNLVLAPGERVSIIGPSGSGKSTFLHALGLLDPVWTREQVAFTATQRTAMGGLKVAGALLALAVQPVQALRFLRPTGTHRMVWARRALPGKIHLDGRDVSRLDEHERARIRNRDIGFVFQAHNLLPEHSALGNVMIPVRLSGSPEDVAEARATALLKAVGLGDRVDHRPGELSGGEQQRVALARALVMGPGLVLADEPTGNLDPRTAVSVFDLLLELNIQLGSTMVVVTHSRDLAARFPRRLSLEDGQFRDW